MKRLRSFLLIVAFCLGVGLFSSIGWAASIPSDAKVFNGHSYKVYELSKNWNEANTYCKQLGGHLATITTGAENTFVTSIVTSGAKHLYWIGLYRDYVGGPWKWVTSENPVFFNWAKGEPNNDSNDNELYVNIYAKNYTENYGAVPGQWNDQNIAGSNPNSWHALKYQGFVCEWDTTNNISSSTVTLSTKSFTYNGEQKKPSTTVRLNGNTLKNGKDYTVSFSNNKNAGTAIVKIKGKGNYTGSKKVYFTINPASISNASVTLSKTSYVYNGKARKPSVTVKLNNKKLGSQDYTVSYSNNTNLGRATVKVTGKTNYTGSVTKTFSITLSTPSLSLSSKNNGEIVAKCGTVKGATKYQIQYYKQGSKAVRSSALNSSATITVKGLTPSAYYYVRARAYASSSSGSVYSPYSSYKRIKVFKATKDLSKAKMTFTQPNTLWVYTGSQICPGVKIKDGIFTLQKGTDYTLSYSNNVNAGTAKVTATGRGKYYGSLSKTFVIGKKGINTSDVSIIGSGFTYSSQEIEPPIAVIVNKKTLRNGTDYTVSHKNNTNAGTATIVVKGNGNYSGTVNKTFVIKPLSMSKCKVSLPQGDRYAYKDNLRPPVLVMYNENKIDYREDLNYRLDYDVREDSDVGHVTVTGVKNLEGSVTLDFKVIKGFIWPAKTTNEAINTLYYYNTFNNGGPHSSHFANFNSIDIGPDGQSNVAIVAVADGIVTTSTYSTSSGFGNYIVIRHDDGTETWYCHLADRHVFKDDVVKQGQTIGIMGNSSAKYNIGIHLHFEWSGGNPWEKYYKDTCNNVKIASDVYQANSRHTSISTCKALIEWINEKCKVVNGYYVLR